MSDKELNYIPQPLSDTMNDISTINHDDNQITFSGETAINITRVDTIGSENKNEKLKVFGTDLKVKSPYRMGNLNTLLFYNGQPIFAIGPQCIYTTNPRLYVNYPFHTYNDI